MPVPKTAPADAGAAETLVVEEESRERSKRKRSPERSPAHPDGGATTKEEEAKSPPPGSKTSYECRFCLMKFEKSQALGGHMNRHRQEREKEQYQEAEELIKSRAKQQMHRNWTSFSTTEIPHLNPDPGALTRMTGQLRSGATRPHAPPISFGSYNRGQAPTSIVSNPSSLLSNYHVASNSSSCNNNNNVQQQQHQQQNLQQWNGDGYSLAALPRSAPQAGNYAVETMISTSLQATVIPPELFANMFRASALNNNHHPSNNINSNNNINNNNNNNNSNINNNNNNVNRSSHINNDSDNINNDSNINNSDNNNNDNNDSSLVPSGTPTNTPQCIYDLYSSYPNSFYGGM